MRPRHPTTPTVVFCQAEDSSLVQAHLVQWAVLDRNKLLVNRVPRLADCAMATLTQRASGYEAGHCV